MDTDECFALLRSGIAGRLAVVDPDGWPYCVPLLYVLLDETVYVHMSSAVGHLRRSLEQSANVCFEVDEPGAVFDYGSFECDSGLAYRSAMVFGTLRVVENETTRHRFCDELLGKYGTGVPGRPKGFYPRLDRITIYALDAQRLTGKQTVLPTESERWPARDRTPTPNARPSSAVARLPS
jgi:nitroimidazol reductase NimA-like FMN-containing flavoprotein (pyridoxamine 5'-phosphate oxidase superfamily)